jgi:hypothetical protein
LVQRGCTEAIKLIFGSKFGRTQKIVGKISWSHFLTFLSALNLNLKPVWCQRNLLGH